MTSKRCKEILQSLKYMIDDYTDEVEEALDMAIKTLEKEILHKPIKSTNRFDDNLLRFHCPTCNEYIAHGNKRVGMLNKFTVSDIRCGYCGQMIDWSGWDEKTGSD